MRPGGPLVDRPGLFHEILADLCDAGFGEADVEWSENRGPPESAEGFALETAFVICNSGMQNRIAAAIYQRVRDALLTGGSAGDVFGHEGKANAIDSIWRNRIELMEGYGRAVDKVGFCRSLPWIGGITCYHLAKNFGAQVAKPDVHMQRLAARHGTDSQTLCETISARVGLSVGTVDVVLWRACAEGILDARSSELRSGASRTVETPPPPPTQNELFQPVQQELFQ
jgi:hypothetical protein